MLLTNVQIIGKGDDNFVLDIEDGRIKDINQNNKNCYSDDNNFTINFENAIAFPGLINSHDHLEFNLFPKLRNKIYNDYIGWGEDIHNQNKELIDVIQKIPYQLRFRYGLYKNLICGVTTVVHHGNGSVFRIKDMPDVFTYYNYLHSTKLENNWKLKLNLSFNRKPFVIHTGEGTNTESFNEINKLINWNLFGKKLIGVHGISMNEQQSKKFRAIVWCPDSNLYLYNKTACISSIKKHTNIIFGTDSTVSAGWNIWNHIRLARNLKLLDDLQLFKSLTITPAIVWGLKLKGLLDKNKAADIVITHKKSADAVNSFYSIYPEDILLILKEGRIVFIDEKLNNSLVFFNKDKFDKLTINSSCKLITRGITDLLKKIKTYIPEYKFPFSAE